MPEAPVKRGPGRPRKVQPEATAVSAPAVVEPTAEAPVKRGPGRPRKVQPVAVAPAAEATPAMAEAPVVEAPTAPAPTTADTASRRAYRVFARVEGGRRTFITLGEDIIVASQSAMATLPAGASIHQIRDIGEALE